jgi:hypothetical protein
MQGTINKNAIRLSVKCRTKMLLMLLMFVIISGNWALSANAETCTYYVSSSTGNDDPNVDGRSEATAWKTINRVNQGPIHAGDVVCFKRGDTWRMVPDGYLNPVSGDSSAYVTYTAYGTGPKPLFLGSVEKNSTSDWTLTSTPNVWTTAANVFIYNVGNLIFNNEGSIGDMVLISEYKQTVCPAGYIKLGVQNGNTFCVGIDPSQPDTRNLNKQGDFVYDWFNGKLLLYSTSNPATYYSDIECALYNHIVNVSGKSYVKVTNLDLRYGGAHGIWASSSSYITASDNDLSYIGGAIQAPTTPGWARVRFGNGIEFWDSNNHMYVERNRISEVYEDALTIQGGGNNEQNNIYFRYNVIKNARFCFTFWNAYYGASNSSQIYFENNTCVGMGEGFGGQTYGPAGMGLGFTPRNLGNTSDFYVRNNIIYKTEGVTMILNDAPDDQWNSMGNLVLDHNAYHQLTGVLIYYPPCLWCDPWGITCQSTWDTGHQDLSCTSYDFQAYRAVTTHDSHSIEADPLFVDVTKNDFHPVTGSPVCNMSNTGGYIGALPCVVYIPDANLKAAIEQTLGKSDPTPYDMLALTTLDAYNRGITDLTGLQYATNLTELQLPGNRISDISALSGLTNMTWLNMEGGNQVRDLSPLSGMKNLQYLYMAGNRITDISVLSGLTELIDIALSGNLVTDISPLSNLIKLGWISLRDPLNKDAYCVYIPLIMQNNPGVIIRYNPNPYPSCAVNIPDANLKAAIEQTLGKSDPTPYDMLALTTLDAYNRGITDLTGLQYATNLTELQLPGNRISDISALSGLTNMTWLNMEGGNQVRDLSPLSGMKNLQYLYMAGNRITDISVLSGLTELIDIALSGNLVTDISPLSNLIKLGWISLRDPLNKDAYCVYIPLIMQNNPGVIIRYNPNPYTC